MKATFIEASAVQLLRSLATAVYALGVCVPLPAAEFCVTNSTELQNALTVAATNGESDTIRIAAGSYSAPAGGFNYDVLEDFQLTLIGGWTPVLQNPCGQTLDNNPLQTVLNGNNNGRVMHIELRQHSWLTLRLLTFMNGSVSGSGGGLWIQANPGGGYAGHINIESNAFLNNTATFAGGLAVSFEPAGSPRVLVTNNVFASNHGEQVGAARRFMAPSGCV